MLANRLMILLVFVLSTLPVLAQELSLADKIDDLYSKWNRGEQPGCAIGVIKDGAVVFAEGYGLANLEHRIPFTPETISDIGSVAKQITDFGIVLLLQEGKLKLTDDIRKYLPEVPDFGQVIEVQHLIHHTSGLREIYETEAIRGNRGGDAIFQEDVLRLVERQQELNFPPGDQYMYCNTAYALLAEIIERVSETKFEDWMQQRIFEPLGMTDTRIMDVQGEIFPNTADSYYYRRSDNTYTKAFDNSTIRGQGGVYTSLNDMLSWMKNLMDPKLGGKEAMEQMTSCGILNNGDTLDYAFGLTVEDYRDMPSIWHSGSSAGYRSLLYIFPEHDLGIMIKNNSPEVPVLGLLKVVTEHFMGDELGEMPPKSQRQVPAEVISLPAEGLKSFAGKYFSPELETYYELYVAEGKLMARNFRQGAFELKPVGKDSFEGSRGYFRNIRFERSEEGEINGLRVSNGRVLNLLFVKS